MKNDGARRDASRWSIRIIVGLILLAAVVAATLIDIPTTGGTTPKPDLPSIALGQEVIYRLEIFLVAFYSGLLIATPAYRGIVSGRLPIEVSARGAKFAEDAAGSIEETQKLVEELRERLRQSEATVARSRLNIDQLAEESGIALRD
jgi:hypothetical protein